jgi:molecular chaperone GrpE
MAIAPPSVATSSGWIKIANHPLENQTFGLICQFKSGIVFLHTMTPNQNPQENQTLEPNVEAPSSDLARELTALQVKHAEVSDAYLRAKAEAENTRRRAEEEISKARKFAVEGFAESLLPVKDSLEAAIALPAATNEQLLEGVHATLRQLSSALERNKVVELNPTAGAKFDPHQHQAISVVPLPAGVTQEPNTVVTVLQKGYSINERVLRPALVTVCAPS